MQHCDTLIAPRWCVPIAPTATALRDHCVIVNDGRIVDLLPRDEAVTRYQPSATIERDSHVLLPGFVNTHTHAAMTLMRGMADDLPLETWLESAIWPAEKQWVSAEMVRDGTALAIAEMLRGGTTCFADQYFFPEIVAATAESMHMRAMIGTPVIDFPTNWAQNLAEYLDKGAELVHDAWADHPLISSCFAPHSTGVLSDDSFQALRVLADQLDRPVQIHLHETAAEVDRAVRETGLRPAARLDELGLVNHSLLAVHGVHLNAAELELFADRGVALAHCPHSNLKLASGIAPLQTWLEAGLKVGLGTDGAASNNALDMLAEMRTATLLGKAVAGDAAALPATAALHMATLGGATALGLDGDIGSVEAGKWADLACIDLAPLNTQPVFDPIAQIVYAARSDQVSDVWIAGRHLLDQGQLLHADTAGIRARAREWQERISANR